MYDLDSKLVGVFTFRNLPQNHFLPLQSLEALFFFLFLLHSEPSLLSPLVILATEKSLCRDSLQIQVRLLLDTIVAHFVHYILLQTVKLYIEAWI